MGMMNMFNPFIGGGGGTSSEDKVARAEIAAIKDGETLDSFSDVETALDNKANTTDILSLDANKLDKTGTAVKATADSDGNNIITTYAKKTDLDDIACTYRGTYTTAEALNAASGDENDYAFYKHTDTNGNTVLDKYIFIPTEQADLPEGYTQLLYIESNGTQYIDTGVPPTSKLRFYVKFNPLDYVYAVAFFGLDGFSSRSFHDPFRLTTDNLDGNFTVDGIDTVIHLNFPGVNEFEYNYPSITVNGAVSSIADPGTWDYPTGSNIYLFAQRYDMQAKASWYSSMRLHACKIYDTDGVTLIRDFIPCKNASNAIGLYDLVNGTFYPNNGTGAFIAGPQANGYWSFEYSIPGNLFSAAQFAAINSSINSTKVAQIETNKTNIASVSEQLGIAVATLTAKIAKVGATYRGTYTTAEALNAASGDANDFAFLKTTDSDGNEIYSRYSRVEIPQVVPEGYTQLMYISSNGTQYIDTGVQAKRDLKSYIKFTRNNGGNNQFFGIHDNGLYYALWFSDWRWQLWCGIGRNYVDISSASSGITEYLLEYPTVTVNDTVFNFSAQADFTSEKNIYLCAVNGESNKSIIDLYECIIYDDDKTTELKHFYPCKNSSNVCGMYETVEGVFYPDANGGNFTAGPQANGYWSFEYSIPGNLFSSTQFAALNSGIDSTKVSQIETNKNNVSSIQQTIGDINTVLEGVL